MHDLVLENARVVTPEGEQAINIAILGEHISALVPHGQPLEATKTLDLSGMVVLPGMMDPHSHLGSGDERDVDGQYRSFAEDTKDAAIGGVTTIATTHVLGRDPLPEMVERAIEAGTGRSCSST